MRVRTITITAVATFVAVVLAVTPAFAVDATQWGGGVYSAYKVVGWHETDYPVWNFDITMTLQPLDFITSLPQATDEWADPDYEWRFTGMIWQPDGGNLANHFVWDTYASTDLPKDDWTHGYDVGPPATDAYYGSPLNDGFVGVFVDDDGGMIPSKTPYDIIAQDTTEFSSGVSIDPTQQKTLSFSVDIWIPDGPGEQNAQMGWTGYKDGKYIRAQNSKHHTPELSPLVLLGLSIVPWGITYMRGQRRRKR